MNRRVVFSLLLALLWLGVGLAFYLGWFTQQPQNLEQHRFMGGLCGLMVLWNVLRAWLQRSDNSGKESWKFQAPDSIKKGGGDAST